VTRTFGAAIGALIFVFFMSYIAERLTTVQAAPARPNAALTR
jgi:flagellar biogenesis protein FliO